MESTAEAQPLLPHGDAASSVERAMTRLALPLPLVVSLLLLPFLLSHLLAHHPPASQGKRHTVATASRNSTLHLLTLNTFIRPRLIGLNDYKDARLSDLTTPLLQHDLLCLQELFWASGARKPRFLESLAPSLPFSAHAPRAGLRDWLQLPPKPIDAGLAILSARPIVQTAFHMFSASAWNSVDWFVGKGVLYARVQVGSGLVHVFTTHMQAGAFPGVRRRQLEEMARFVGRVTADDSGGVVVVAGDLNVDGRGGGEAGEYDRMMRIWRGVGVMDVMKREVGQAVTTAGGLWGVTQKNERIDYVLLRRGSGSEGNGSRGVVASVPRGGVRVEELRVQGRPYQTMSDHYAVVAEILVLRKAP